MKKSPALDAQFAASLATLPHHGKLAIACSGGLDSSVLLHLAQVWARQHNVALYAFHVHHGLSPNADAWLAHCEQQCNAAGATFGARRIALQGVKQSGVEAAARKQRYAALGELCREHGVQLLLTAHHLDDQAETVLLQLLRGSGTAGLSGMDASNHAASLLQNNDLLLARPLLAASRRQLEAFQQAFNVPHIDDESNADPRYARNALRHLVMPALARHFPGFQDRFARSAQHAQSAQRLLDELADQDLQAGLDGDALNLAYLRTLSTDRQYNLLRRWFHQRGMAMPSTAWLHEMLEQLISARGDANLCVTHPECDVRRHRDRLLLAARLPELAGMREDRFEDAPEQAFTWQGEAQLAFPAYGGVLHIDQAPAGQGGLADGWLRAQALIIGFRNGGETLKPAPNRPTRSLKRHYQALGVPAWERERLPVVKAGGATLFAAQIGMDCHHLVADDSKRWVFRWEAK